MTRTLKISMPDDFYDEFVKDAKLNYDNCYWLKISADSKIYKGIAGAVIEQRDVQDAIMVIRKELIALTNQRYNEDVSHLKKMIMKYKAKGYTLE